MMRRKRAFRVDDRSNDSPSLLLDDEARRRVLRDFPEELHNNVANRIDELAKKELQKANAPSAADISHTVNQILDAVDKLGRQLRAAHREVFGGLIGIGIQQGLKNFKLLIEALEVQKDTYEGMVNPKGGRRKCQLKALQKPLEQLYQELMPNENTLNTKTNARHFAKAIIKHYKGGREEE